MLLVDDHQAQVGERGEDGQAGPDDEVDRARSDPAPLIGSFAGAQPGMEEGDPGIEVGPQAIDDRQGEGDLGDEQEDRATQLEAGRDRLDVDGGLAAAGDPVKEQRRWIALDERLPDPGDRGRLGLGQRRRGGPCPAPARRPVRQRPARALPDLDRQQAAPDETGQGRGPVATTQLCSGNAGRSLDELSDESRLAGSERSAINPLPGRQLAGRNPARVGRQRPALVARPAGGAQQRPVEIDRAGGGQTAQATDEAGPAFRGGNVARRPGTVTELVEQLTIGLATLGCRVGVGPDLGHQLESLEHPGRKHRPQDEGGRGEVVAGDPAGELEREGGQQRAVGADSLKDRLDLDPGRRPASLAKNQPEGLTPPVFDKDRLACFEVGQPGRDGIRVGPGAARAGRIDRHLDQSLRGWLAEHQSWTRRSAWRAPSSAMILPISSAVRASWPVSLTTT